MLLGRCHGDKERHGGFLRILQPVVRLMTALPFMSSPFRSPASIAAKPLAQLAARYAGDPLCTPMNVATSDPYRQPTGLAKRAAANSAATLTTSEDGVRRVISAWGSCPIFQLLEDAARVLGQPALQARITMRCGRV